MLQAVALKQQGSQTIGRHTPKKNKRQILGQKPQHRLGHSLTCKSVRRAGVSRVFLNREPRYSRHCVRVYSPICEGARSNRSIVSITALSTAPARMEQKWLNRACHWSSV